jgi:hypothetical protein
MSQEVRMIRLLFVAAAVYNFTWVVILSVWPEKIMMKMPPLMALMIVFIGLIGVAFVLCAVKPLRGLITFTILAKIAGVLSFFGSVQMSYLSWDQWWMPLFNDLIWLPPLIAVRHKAKRE